MMQEQVLTNAVQTLAVAEDEGELRLDRWFRRRFPQVGHGMLERLLRTGQIRVDGKRAKSNLRLEVGQAVRVPPLADIAGHRRRPRHCSGPMTPRPKPCAMRFFTWMPTSLC